MGDTSKAIEADLKYNEYITLMLNLEDYIDENLYIGDSDLYLVLNYETEEINLKLDVPARINSLPYEDWYKITDYQTRETLLKRHIKQWETPKIDGLITIREEMIHYFRANSLSYMMYGSY